MTDSAACSHADKRVSQRSDVGRYVYCHDCGKVLHANL